MIVRVTNKEVRPHEDDQDEIELDLVEYRQEAVAFVNAVENHQPVDDGTEVGLYEEVRARNVVPVEEELGELELVAWGA